jgi:uncharacterized OB-fold protein
MATEQPLTIYTWWDQLPEHLKTKTQLGELGFKPGGPIRAQIEYGKGRRHRIYDLYDQREAVQKVATPAQLRALEQARIKQRTCTRCGKVVERPSDLSPRGRCPACLAELATVAEIELELRRLLHGKTVVVYNAMYDSTRFEEEIARMCTPSDEQLLWLIDKDWSRSMWADHQWNAWNRYDEYRRLVSDHAQWWRDRVSWECAMAEYAVFYGDWNERYRNYSYQALRGGHRAVGDCRACLDLLHRMADTPLSTETPRPVLDGQALEDVLDAEAYAMQLEADGRHPDDDPAQYQKVS